MTSDVFLDTHVNVVMRSGNFFPDVLLTMSEDADKTCPFLGEQACTVYRDRPDTCRTFPLEQGIFHGFKEAEFLDALCGKVRVQLRAGDAP